MHLARKRRFAYDRAGKKYIPDEDEKIIQIEVERLTTFKDHPFRVQEDSDMKLLMESIEKFGILNPLIVRPMKEGVYEIISGHRRRFAAEKLGYRKVPVIIRVMRDEESVIAMVDGLSSTGVTENCYL